MFSLPIVTNTNRACTMTSGRTTLLLSLLTRTKIYSIQAKPSSPTVPVQGARCREASTSTLGMKPPAPRAANKNMTGIITFRTISCGHTNKNPFNQSSPCQHGCGQQGQVASELPAFLLHQYRLRLRPRLVHLVRCGKEGSGHGGCFHTFASIRDRIDVNNGLKISPSGYHHSNRCHKSLLRLL